MRGTTTEMDLPAPGPVAVPAGVRAYRSIHLGAQSVPTHGHSGIAITIPLIGSLATTLGGKPYWVSGASVIVHPEGAAHGGEMGWSGLDSVEFEIDPLWLSDATLRSPDRSISRSGGTAGAAARALADLCLARAPGEVQFRRGVKCLLDALRDKRIRRVPTWIGDVQALIRSRPGYTSAEVARDIGVSVAWLQEAYREYAGEGLQASMRRQRVERATLRLRHTETSLAHIATDSGFCDQSHMNRAFRSVLGCTPLDVRRTYRPSGVAFVNPPG